MAMPRLAVRCSWNAARRPLRNGRCDVFVGAAVAFHRHIDRPGFVGLQLEGVGCGACGEAFRHGLEQHRRPPPFAVEALVVQRDPAFANLGGRDAAAGAAHSPHLEQVGEVAGEGERQPDLERTIAVVLDAQALVGGAAPEKKRSHDVQHVLGQHQLLIEIDVGIGQIDGENGVVVADA